MTRSYSRRALSQRCHLLVIQTDEAELTYALQAATYAIGRDPTNSIVLDFDAVSRHHAVLMRVPQADHFRYRLMDGNLVGEPSTNGTWVNDRRETSADLEDGDQISFGGAVTAHYYWRTVEDAEAIPVAVLKSTRLQAIDSVPTSLLGPRGNGEA